MAELDEGVVESAEAPAWRQRSLSIRYVLVLVVTIGLLLPALSISGFSLYRTYQHERAERLSALLRQYSELLEPGLAIALWNLDRDSAVRIVQSAMSESSVIWIAVDDDRGERWVVNAKNGFSVSDSDSRLERKIEYGGRKVGALHLVMSDAAVREALSFDVQMRLFLLLVQLVFSLALIVYLLNRRVLGPLDRLGEAARRLGQQELGQPIVSERDDEIGRLAMQLESARGQLLHFIDALYDQNSKLELELAERRRAKQEIEALNARLEVRVAERTQDLERANFELRTSIEALNVARNEIVRSEKLAALGALVAGIAHELNTPIGNAVTVASAMLERTKDLSKMLAEGMRRSELERYVNDAEVASDLIQRNLFRASELISGFKQVAVDQTSSQRRDFMLDEVVQEMALILGPGLRKANALLETVVPREISMDGYPGPLGQVINNLVMNAVVHAFDGGPGAIRIAADLTDNNQVRLIFSDNGCGIPQNRLLRIFDPFFTTKLGRGGSGLGLHIVHNIVTGLLGGSIRVSSEVGVGTQFVVELPRTAPRTQSRLQDALPGESE